MSKIGKKPVSIPEGVTVSISSETVEIKGERGVLHVPLLPGVNISEENGVLVLSPKDKQKQTLSNWGTMRSLVQNAVLGAKEDFVKELVLEGVGYRASVEGNEVVLGLGYSHPIRYKIPDGIHVTTEKNTIRIAGADKAQVGEVAAEIRSFRKPEPYKGKGVRYSDEVVRRKAGKKAVGAGK